MRPRTFSTSLFSTVPYWFRVHLKEGIITSQHYMLVNLDEWEDRMLDDLECSEMSEKS